MSARRTGQKMRPEGQLRQSQLITTYGPGSMVDLVDRSVLIGGLEHWEFGREGFVALDDARLRRALIPRLKALDPDLDLAKENYFRMPPAGDDQDPSRFNGIRALEFPKWFVCKGCRRLLRAPDQLDEVRGRYRHQCERNKREVAIPVRFVAACERGHLSDFPWVFFVHRGREGRCERPELYLEERSLGDFGEIQVRCKTCNVSARLSEATAWKVSCYGDRPWLGGANAREECDQPLKLLSRTASDAYFSQTVTALRLPDPEPELLRKRLRLKHVWSVVKDVEQPEVLEVMRSHVEAVREAL